MGEVADKVTPSTVSMKLLIDTKAKRVLFAEAGKDCIDFLFQLLSLPVASWPNLYHSLEDLKPAAPPSSSSVPLLALNDAQIQKNFYKCGSSCNYTYVSDDPRAVCPSCRVPMSKSLTYVGPPAVGAAAGDGGLVTYMVMDDLEVKPMSTISSIALLNMFNVKDVGALEVKVVNLGMTEALKLLKFSQQSKNVLTHVFFS